MIEDYRNALRAGQRAYRACVARGQSPYLKVLDEILNGVDIVAQEPLGLVDIPAEQHNIILNIVNHPLNVKTYCESDLISYGNRFPFIKSRTVIVVKISCL